MFRKWLQRFVKPQVIVVERGDRLEPLTPDIEQAMLSLQAHPGFLRLLAELKFQKAGLTAQLLGDRHSREDDLWLKAGVFWSGWLEQRLEQILRVRSQRKQGVDLQPDELAALNEIAAATEIVGSA